jgi:hypothetical protein
VKVEKGLGNDVKMKTGFNSLRSGFSMSSSVQLDSVVRVG